MQVLEAYKPFEIQEIELTDWKQRPVKNNFFELVLIKDGEGTQCINYNDYRYSKNSMFLLPPLKCHSFTIEKPTRFVFLKFTYSFFKKQVKMSLREYIIKAKLKLVEIRLLNSDFTLTQIADELGFTDVSHLSKTFKRYAGTSIREFKNNGEYMLLKRNACAS
jgi:hypothetical protein